MLIEMDDILITENPATMSAHRKIELIAKDLGISLKELAEEAAREEAARREAQQAARLKAEAERLEAEQRRAVEALETGIAAGVVVAFIDGHPVEVLGCPEGGDLVKAPLAQRIQRVRQQFVAGGNRRLPGAASTEYSGAIAAEILASVPCSCERGAHDVRVFVSSAPVV